MSQLERIAPRPDSDGYKAIHTENLLRLALADPSTEELRKFNGWNVYAALRQFIIDRRERLK